MRLNIQEKIQDSAIAAVRRPGSGAGAATWCSSASLWRANRSALPRPTAVTGSCASPASTWASSTVGRKSFTAFARLGRAGRKPNERRKLLPMYPVCSVTHLSGCSRNECGGKLNSVTGLRPPPRRARRMLRMAALAPPLPLPRKRAPTQPPPQAGEETFGGDRHRFQPLIVGISRRRPVCSGAGCSSPSPCGR